MQEEKAILNKNISKMLTLKQLGLVLFLMLTGVAAIAQPKSGDFLLGGSLSFNRQRGQLPDNPTNGTLTENSFKFAPQVGLFFTPRIFGGFSTRVDYASSTSSFVKRDSAGNKFDIVQQSFKLKFSFGFYASYYYPINDKLFWVNTLEPHWGTINEGDRLASLFSENKPQQERRKFLTLNYITGVQYFAKPNLSIIAGINPFTYTYEYQKVVRDNTPISKQDKHTISFTNIARGFYIGVNFLIISDNE